MNNMNNIFRYFAYLMGTLFIFLGVSVMILIKTNVFQNNGLNILYGILLSAYGFYRIIITRIKAKYYE